MPNSLSAAKRLRQSKKRAERNGQVKLNIAYILKKARKAVEAKDKTAAQDWARKYQKAVDKAIQGGVYHKNTGARMKSRLISKIKSI
jgi:small subunit ribosomal protein S20